VTSAPDAFLSYTRFDDPHDGGAISEFRLRLSSAVRAVTGRPFEIFQDIDGIGLGEKWLGKLDQILDQARFFIPIVTPSYFSSAACRDELEKFLRAEAARGRSDLVLPIYYIECDVLEDPDLRRVDSLASAIHERQRQDWRDLRFEPFAEPRVRKALENLAREIARARRRETPLTQHQPSDKPQSAAPRLVAQFKEPPLRYGYDLAPSTIFRDIDVPWCPELVVVPAGKFMMGEGQHEVRIAYGLAVGRYPITFDECDPFAQATDRDPPRDHGWGRGRRPVINVSCEEAKAYVQWLREETGHAYRLLSEAEWEYAARAGTATPFWTGSTIDTAAAN